MKHNSLNLKQITRSQRWYRNYLVLLGSFLVAFCAASTFAPVYNSGAYQELSITNTLTDYHLNITPDAATVSLPVEANPSGQLAAGKTTVNVETNSPSGYQLYLSTYDLDNNIYKDGSSSNSSLGYFSPTSGSLDAPIALSQNTWGFALNKSSGSTYSANFADLSNYATGTTTPAAGSTWAGVPTSDHALAIMSTSAADYPSGTDIDIYYGVNASTSIPAGEYSTKITYTAISEGVNVFDTMQEFTSEKCDNMSTDSSINLTDNRDGKYYRISKLKDGHCWMTQNLALDGTDASGNVRTLLPSDSNVTTSRKLAANIESGTKVAYDEAQIFSGVAENTTTSDTTGHSIVSDEKYGNLYNWNAATAGVGLQATTGTVTESICPKGWRLPDSTGDFSWANLMGKYGYPTTNTTNAQDGKTHEYIEAIQGAPLHIPLAGYYNGSAVAQGASSSLLSRTVYSSITNNAYDFYFVASSGYFYPQNYNGFKLNGTSVRCVFGGQSDEIMQNFTTAQCTALSESTAAADNHKTMIDSRDGKFYKISKLADGNCWMVQNLALDGMDGLGAVRTLTTADSNVTEDRTFTLNTNVTEENSGHSYSTPKIYAGLADSTSTTKVTDHTIISNEPYGNQYNWNAATATVGVEGTSGIVEESICPAGWRLPSYTGEKSWSNLVSSYGYPAENVNINTDSASYDYVEAMQQSPFFIPLAGQSHGSSLSYQGKITYLWTQQVVSSTQHWQARILSINADTGAFSPKNNLHKDHQASVRCVTSE